MAKILPGQPSPEQQGVIDYKGKQHLQIIACAGSGKTETISRRVADLISDGIQPVEIVAFTFTERAASSLKRRIFTRVEQAMGTAYLDRLGPMYIGTIHSYCFRLLQDHVPHYANFDVLDEHRLAGLLSREHRRLGLDRLGDHHWSPIHEFMRNADVVENELIDPQKIKGPFGQCYRQYREILERYHLLTYGQMIALAVQALKKPEVYARVHADLKYLIVDEYQDINPAQERLIQLLAQPLVQLCIVGDDEQAIYQWRGSEAKNILTFARRYRQVRTFSLSTNYRSRPNIIATANGFAKSIKPRLAKQMRPARSGEGPQFHAWSAESPLDEANIIADTIENLFAQGYQYQDMAILLRSVRTSGAVLVDVFRKRGIPSTCGGRTGLFAQPEAQVLGETYAWLSGNDWRNGRSEEKTTVSLSDLIKAYSSIFKLSSSAGQSLRKHLEKWRQATASDDEPANLIRGYYRLLRLLNVQKWDLADPTKAARIGTLARFSELLADFEHIRRRARWVDGEYRAGTDRGAWFYRNLFNYLQFYARDAYEDFEGEDTFDLDAVNILTVHQAKGLEWPIVFVPCLVKGRFPASRTGEEQKWLLPESLFPEKSQRRYEGSETDERRLFYVAMTRAKDMLYLSRFQKMKTKRQSSPFLLEVAHGEPPMASLGQSLPVPTKTTTANAKSEADGPTLTFSDLAAYESCPQSYRLSAMMGFQPQIVAELGYGRAIHHILRRVADQVRRSESLPTTEEVNRIFDAEFYLPFAHHAAYQKLREAAGKLVKRYLDKYSADLFRIWETERPFELHLPKGIVTGRADVILDRENGIVDALALVDYKTATDPLSNDVYAFQLSVYTAAGWGEGVNVTAAYLHDLAVGDRKPISVSDVEIEKAKNRADNIVDRMVAKDFQPMPERHKCSQCDVRLVPFQVSNG
jgi:DNA helicase II / ATP-dependent DNA helicase PcrA